MSSQPHQSEVKAAASKKGSKPIRGSIKRQICASFIKKMKSILLCHKRSNDNQLIFLFLVHARYPYSIYMLTCTSSSQLATCLPLSPTHIWGKAMHALGEKFCTRVLFVCFQESRMFGGWRNNTSAIMICVYL